MVEIVETPRLRELREAVERSEQRLAELNAEIEARRQAARERNRELRRLAKNIRENPGDWAAVREMQEFSRLVMIELASNPKGMAEALDRFSNGGWAEAAAS